MRESFSLQRGQRVVTVYDEITIRIAFGGKRKRESDEGVQPAMPLGSPNRIFGVPRVGPLPEVSESQSISASSLGGPLSMFALLSGGELLLRRASALQRVPTWHFPSNCRAPT